MSKKYLTLLTGILISGCNSNGTASKVSPQLPQVIKSVASSVNKAKVGAILGTYVCTFHNHKTGIYDGQIPTSIKVPGEFKKLQNISFMDKTLDVTLFMPSEAPDYNKIIKKCEDLNLDPDGDVIDGVKISTDSKSSFLYDIYNPNLNVKGKDNFLEELNKRSNVILSENIKSGAQFMRKSNLEDYMTYNFIHRKIPVYISTRSSDQGLLHSGSRSGDTFKTQVFDLFYMNTMLDVINQVDRAIFYINSDSGFASVQHPKDYKYYSLDDDSARMIANFIVAYDVINGFELVNDALTANYIGIDIYRKRLSWKPVAMSYQILNDEYNHNMKHVYVTDVVKPVFQGYFDKTLRTLELNETYQITIDYILDKSKYKFPASEFAPISVVISKVAPIKDFTTTSSSFEKKGVFDPTEDFMRQMVFNNYQNLSSRDYIDEDERRVRNNDVWVLK